MINQSNLNLADVLEKCIREDRKAQNNLYREYYSLGMSIAIRYVKSEGMAKDILNQAFFKVFNNLKSFDLSREFKPWFSRIVVNTALSHIKKENRFISNDIDNVKIPQHVVNDFDKSLGYEEILGMIFNLSFAYRTVFNLYVIDGYKHEEIAQKLSISIGTSKSNLSRAKKHLREMLLQKRKADYVR